MFPAFIFFFFLLELIKSKPKRLQPHWKTAPSCDRKAICVTCTQEDEVIAGKLRHRWDDNKTQKKYSIILVPKLLIFHGFFFIIVL